jgi:hypothetical protein
MAQSTSSTQDYSFTITDFIQDWVDRSVVNFGLMLKLQAEQSYTKMVFGSSDNSTQGIKPKLEVYYIVEDENRTLYPDKDAALFNYSSWMQTNYATVDKITAGAWTKSGVPYEYRSLLEFDLSSIPEKALITKADLYLESYGIHEYASQNNATWMYLVTESWDEETVAFYDSVATDTTGKVALARSTSATQDYTVDLKDYIQDWVDGTTTNYGLLYRLQTEQYYARMVFYSSDASDHTKHPKIDLEYVIPEVVINSTGLYIYSEYDDTLHYKTTGCGITDTTLAGDLDTLLINPPSSGTDSLTVKFYYKDATGIDTTFITIGVDSIAVIQFVHIRINGQTYSLDTNYYSILNLRTLRIWEERSYADGSLANDIYPLLEDGILMSPDDDESYDVLEFAGLSGVSSYSLTIYDMNGIVVATSNEVAYNWDGIHKDSDPSELVIPGTYRYVIQADGEEISGDFLIDY